jgi:hypothetical protein
MTPLFLAAVHTATRLAQKKDQANTARKGSGIIVILFYGIFLAMILLIAWLASAFFFE